MYILTLIFITLLNLIILLSLFHVKVIFALNLEQRTNLKFMISWLYPMFKVVITKDENNNIIHFYLFNKKIFIRTLKMKKRNSKISFDLIKSIKLDYIKLRTSYGFENPAITGWMCASISLILNYVEIKELTNTPDFSMDSNYMNFNGETKVNIVSTLINFAKLKASN